MKGTLTVKVCEKNALPGICFRVSWGTVGLFSTCSCLSAEQGIQRHGSVLLMLSLLRGSAHRRVSRREPLLLRTPEYWTVLKNLVIAKKWGGGVVCFSQSFANLKSWRLCLSGLWKCLFSFWSCCHIFLFFSLSTYIVCICRAMLYVDGLSFHTGFRGSRLLQQPDNFL